MPWEIEGRKSPQRYCLPPPTFSQVLPLLSPPPNSNIFHIRILWKGIDGSNLRRADGQREKRSELAITQKEGEVEDA